MAEKKELNPSPRFPSGDYPKLSPNPNQVDGLVNKTGEKPNTQVVNLPKEQEKRCLTVSEVIALIKLIAPQYGADNVKFKVDNIKSLTDAQCEDLEVGDMVAKKTGNQYHVYVVTYKEKNQGLCLTYTDASVVETQSYDYTEGHWVYNSEDKTDFSNIGGLPEVTALDNGKVLEVINGVWGKGLSKANAIKPPLSTTLIDEEIELISGGTLMNGDFIGISNPQFYPAYNFGDALSGYVFGQNSSGQFVICSYEINDTTKQITNTGTWIMFNQSGGRYIDIKGPYGAVLNLNSRRKPQVEVALTNLGTITSTETATGSGFYKNDIPYTGGISNEDVINVKMSNGAVYQAINDTANSQLVIYTAVNFATNSISVSKCWKLAY